MKLIIKNNSSDERPYVGGSVTVLPESDLDVAFQYWSNLSKDDSFLNDLRLNNIQLSDGVAVYRMVDAIQYLRTILLEAERDTDNTPLSRGKITKTGWHFQLHSIEIKTATWNGFHNKKIDPATLEEIDLGFVTYKLFDENRQEITDQENVASACYTQIDWATNHEEGIIGAIFSQTAPPSSDIRMYTIGAPGILNIPFGVGGLNLKNIGVGGVIDADGKAEKYLHPTAPIPGLNKFRTILVHGPGVVHTCQLMYRLFKPTT